ncbi:hypothetical protein P9112_011861 [Eukaryota sp. TZLM1-RC]
MKLLVLLSIALALVSADHPVTCFAEHAFGPWEFVLSTPQSEPVKNCRGTFLVHDRIQVQLEEPNLVTHGQDKGEWTMIYNQGVDLRTPSLSVLWFFNFTEDKTTGEIKSFCDESYEGWYENKVTKQYGCLFARRKSYVPPLDFEMENEPFTTEQVPLTYTVDSSRQFDIPNVGRQWVRYRKPVDLQKMFYSTESHPKNLPVNFSWRDTPGIVPEVRNQASCGSCYIFAFTAAMSARIAIKNEGNYKPNLSPQQVIDCNPYGQGCQGGFAMPVGRFAHETGLVEETYYPYQAENNKCRDEQSYKHYKVSDYGIVGGYYGNCSEEQIMRELHDNGPVSIAFAVPRSDSGGMHPSFKQYESGVYMFNEYEIKRFGWFVEVTHAVTLTGYGVENGMKYWEIQNSWGSEWGDSGYFKLVRGIDNLGIESMAETMDPIIE